MKNKITDLNNALFAQLERLTDEDLTDEALEKEILRAKAVGAIATNIVNTAKLTLDAINLLGKGDVMPEQLQNILPQKTIA